MISMEEICLRKGERNIKSINNHLRIGICLVIVSCFLGFYSFAQAKEYDGLWFLGFNLHKDIFSDVSVRQAVNYAIDRQQIATKIISDETTPNGVIPPGMLGYDPKLADYGYNVKKAKALFKDAGFKGATLSLLHTDGLKTIEIAKLIRKNLATVGIKVILKQVPYSDQEKWNAELQSGRHHMFLMGYKASPPGELLLGDKSTKFFHRLSCEKAPDIANQVFFGSYEEAAAAGYSPCRICNPKPGEKYDTYALLQPLFNSKGEANFTYYINDRVDLLLDQISETDLKLERLRAEKLKEINRLILKDAPTVNLFYITKL